MAASIALQIAQAVAVLLTVPEMTSVAAAQVRTEPIHPADVEHGAALNIELGDEPPAERTLIGFKDRVTELKLTAIAAGASAVSSADELITEAHARLMSDESLGGLSFDIAEAGVNRSNSTNGRRLSVIEKTYLVHYQTTESSL